MDREELVTKIDKLRKKIEGQNKMIKTLQVNNSSKNEEI